MHNRKIKLAFILSGTLICFSGCGIPKVTQRTENKTTPVSYNNMANIDSLNVATISWRTFFTDSNLVKLIDTALANNQELMITLQEIEIAKNDIRAKKGALLPTLDGGLGVGADKVGRYTSQGAGDESTEITPGKKVPEILGDFKLGVNMEWEIDIWKKLRNAKKATVKRYLATIEGKNFVLTNLIAEIANSYYELVALDNELDIIRQNIITQKNALEVVKAQKEAGRATELAVQKFQAEVFGTQSKEYEVLEQIKETENKINFLMGRFPQEIPRSKDNFIEMIPPIIHSGIPSQLLQNRPDIKKAELELDASKLDVKVAKAEFYPSLKISSSLGLDAFSPAFWIKLPASIFGSLAADLLGPLANRNAIKAEYLSANARQKQAVYNFERSILNGYVEVSTQLYKIDNLQKNYDLKSKQIDALNKSVVVANDLFSSARADYFEVLMTQRDALESKLELIETKQHQLNAVVDVYKSLGGGWR
ncbi:MAG: TolC family protein [Chitinophagales bacterium]